VVPDKVVGLELAMSHLFHSMTCRISRAGARVFMELPAARLECPPGLSRYGTSATNLINSYAACQFV
jgi:hypothetical protein